MAAEASTTHPSGRAPAGGSTTRDLGQQGRQEWPLKTRWLDTLGAAQAARHTAIDGRCIMEGHVHADLQHRGSGICGCPARSAHTPRSAVPGRHLLLHIATATCCNQQGEPMRCSAAAQHSHLLHSVYVHAAKLVVLLCALMRAPVDLLVGSNHHPIPAGCLHTALEMPPACEAHAALAPTTLQTGRR